MQALLERRALIAGGVLASGAGIIHSMTSSALAQVKPLPNAGGMTGTINYITKEIYIFGALTDKDDVNTNIQVNILDVKPGVYSVTKVEANNQTVDWNVWALRFGYGVTYEPNIVRASSNYFTKIKWAADRNCLVYYGGTVKPGQILVKRWGFDYKGGGPIQIQHYERTTPDAVTDEEVEKGWGDKPVSATINLTLDVVA